MRLFKTLIFHSQLALCFCLPVVLFASYFMGCDSKKSGKPSADIAVASSYLECVVRDLMGENAPVNRLAEPGMCPGHFDIRPNQVQQLRACRVLLRFEFQSSLDREMDTAKCSIVPLKISGGMCEPESYLEACKQAAEGLAKVSMLDAATVDSKLAAIRARVDQTAIETRNQIEAAGLKGAPVIASGHQAAFCRWLGLNVVAVVGGEDVASVKDVDTALKKAMEAQCRLVIANKPEGTQLAQSIAERLGAALVVFDNFPTLTESQPDFDGLVRDNVQRLIKAGIR